MSDTRADYYTPEASGNAGNRASDEVNNKLHEDVNRLLGIKDIRLDNREANSHGGDKTEGGTLEKSADQLAKVLAKDGNVNFQNVSELQKLTGQVFKNGGKEALEQLLTKTNEKLKSAGLELVSVPSISGGPRLELRDSSGKPQGSFDVPGPRHHETEKTTDHADKTEGRSDKTDGTSDKTDGKSEKGDGKRDLHEVDIKELQRILLEDYTKNQLKELANNKGMNSVEKAQSIGKLLDNLVQALGRTEAARFLKSLNEDKEFKKLGISFDEGTTPNKSPNAIGINFTVGGYKYHADLCTGVKPDIHPYVRGNDDEHRPVPAPHGQGPEIRIPTRR